MANSSLQIPKAHLIMALCLPLAVLLGYFLAEPMDSGSFAIIVLVLAVLAVPIMMKWYHPLLIFSWNLFITPNFLPGRPTLWMLMALAGIVFALLNRSVQPDRPFLLEPSLTKSLIFLAAVVGVTAFATGGFGFASLGGSKYGGKNYFQLIAAIVGFFVFASLKIKPEKANMYVALFFLSNLSALVPNIAYKLGPSAYFLFNLFPVDLAIDQAQGDYSMNHMIVRISGLSFASPGVYCWLLARYGIRGIFDLSKPWRAAFFFLAVFGCFASGFRSILIALALTMMVLFYFEGLLRTRATALLVGCGLVILVFLCGFSERLPLAIQRTVSFLPVKVDPMVAIDAKGSTEWRLQMWSLVLPEIPKYLIKGKGYSMNPQDIEMVDQANSYSSVIAANDFHNGPLSVIIPFGIFGAAAFLWFLIASVRYLLRCYREGDARLKTANALLLSLFVARAIAFFLVFGSLYSDMWFFAGVVGFGVSLNGVSPQNEEVPELAEAAVLEPVS